MKDWQKTQKSEFEIRLEKQIQQEKLKKLEARKKAFYAAKRERTKQN